jgi:ribosomal protein S18 acetylase RimI-like enzyme
LNHPIQGDKLMQIRVAVKADAEAIKDLVKAVFRDDPLMTWFLLQDHRREAALEAFYDFMVNTYCLPHGLTWVADGVAGAALWIPPGKFEPSLRVQVAMVGVVIRSFGWRNLPLKFAERQKIDSGHPKTPHYYLAGLAVRKELRGKGVGSALLRPVLERSDREGVGCYLEASLERNVDFYRKRGFAVARQLAVGPGKLPVWTMWRDPKGG